MWDEIINLILISIQWHINQLMACTITYQVHTLKKLSADVADPLIVFVKRMFCSYLIEKSFKSAIKCGQRRTVVDFVAGIN